MSDDAKLTAAGDGVPALSLIEGGGLESYLNDHPQSTRRIQEEMKSLPLLSGNSENKDQNAALLRHQEAERKWEGEKALLLRELDAMTIHLSEVETTKNAPALHKGRLAQSARLRSFKAGLTQAYLFEKRLFVNKCSRLLSVWHRNTHISEVSPCNYIQYLMLRSSSPSCAGARACGT